jgi:nitrogen fixation protein
MMRVSFSLLLAFALLMTALAQPAQAAGNTCVYALGTIAGQTVTTPGVLVPIANTDMTVDPARVHVNESTHSILGYSLRLPGLDLGLDPTRLYVPGTTLGLPSFVLSLADLNLNNKTCVSFGVTTPAVPIHIPASALEIPGVQVDVPAVHMNILGQERVVGGKVILYNGRTIVVPGVDAVVPPQTIETPDSTIIFNLNGTLQSAHYMASR